MKKHTLLIHHFEDTWTGGLRKFGITPEEMSHNIIDYLHSEAGRHINHVIHTTWEIPGPDEVYEQLLGYLKARGIPFEHQVMGYAETREMYENTDFTLIQATRYADDPDQIVCIEPWHLALAESTSVSLCGAFEGECIRDAEDMLAHVLGQDGYTKIDSLVVGTGVKYNRHFHYDAIRNKANELISEVDELFSNSEFDDREAAIADFKTKLCKQLEHPALQLIALFPSEEVGDLYAESDEVAQAIVECIGSISLIPTSPRREADVAFSL